jgi:hypothetical protein
VAAPVSVFSSLSLQEALDESKAKARLLVVVVSPDRAKAKAHTALWNNPALAAWARHHAVVAHVTDAPTIQKLRDAGLVVGQLEGPLVFRDGLSQRLFGVNPTNGVPRVRPAPALPKGVKPRSEDEPNLSLRLLLRLEWTLRSMEQAEPAWYANHAANNPPPTLPEVGTLFDKASDGVDAAGGLLDAAAPAAVGAGGGRRDVLAVLVAALTAANDPATHSAAAGLYTWLWERGAEEQPGFEPILLTTVAEQMHALGRVYAPARARFVALREAHAARVPWMSRPELARWIMLARVADEHLETLDLIDWALDDPDGKLLMPPGERGVWEALLPRLNWADPLTLPESGTNPAAYVAGLVAKRDAAAPTKPVKWSPTDHAAYTGTLGWLVRHESARLYAAALAAGKTDAAARLAAATPAAQRASLAAAALVAGKPLAEHLEWAGAGESGGWPGLKERIGAALKAGAGGPGK